MLRPIMFNVRIYLGSQLHGLLTGSGATAPFHSNSPSLPGMLIVDTACMVDGQELSAHQRVLAISCGLKWGIVRAAVAAAASMRVLPGWCRSVANAHVALLMSCGTHRGRSVSSCRAAAARKGSHGT